MSSKCIITRTKSGVAYCEFKDDIPIYADIYSDNEKNIIGNIYVGYVKDIVKNINCAFVEYEPGKKAYLQLNENVKPVFLNNKNTSKLCAGDRIIIQITKDAIKTKDPVCTTKFELASQNLVLYANENTISFSKKIADNDFKKRMISLFSSSFSMENYGFLLRTNAINTDESVLLSEAAVLEDEYKKILNIANTRTKNFCIKESDDCITTLVKTLSYTTNDCIITDNRQIYDIIKNTDTSAEVKFYDDEMLPIYKLYGLETIFKELSSKKVWLKSGAYLIIEHTEAMTIIDVNTGKCDKGRDKESTFLKINMEAAGEIARQLSLRNISGIIIIDFIDMQDKSNQSLLFEAMKEYVKNDRIPTNIIDFTRLNLMEITRKKGRRQLMLNEDLW